MTRKDYVAISDVMSTLLSSAVGIRGNDSIFWPVVEGSDPVPPTAYVAHVAYALCDVFAADNPRFDRKRFLSACAIGKGKDDD